MSDTTNQAVPVPASTEPPPTPQALASALAQLFNASIRLEQSCTELTQLTRTILEVTGVLMQVATSNPDLQLSSAEAPPSSLTATVTTEVQDGGVDFLTIVVNDTQYGTRKEHRVGRYRKLLDALREHYLVTLRNENSVYCKRRDQLDHVCPSLYIFLPDDPRHHVDFFKDPERTVQDANLQDGDVIRVRDCNQSELQFDQCMFHCVRY